MRRPATVLLALMLVVSGLSLTSASGASSTPVPFPAKPKGLPAPVELPTQLDPVPAYVPQIACQPGTPAGVEKLRALVLETYGVGGVGNTARTCAEGTSEHADGRARDWMVHVDKAKEKKAAGDFLAWLTASGGKNARRLGIMYVIHNKLIWASYRAKDGWRKSSGHTDHIHISFSWNGAKGATSFWTGAVQPVDYGPCARFAGQPAVVRSTLRATPCPRPAALVKKHKNKTIMYGSRASTVKTAQGLLGVPKSGTFNLTTRTAVKAYQKAHDLPITGAVDVPTWASLVPSKVTSDITAGYSRRRAAAYGLENYSYRGWSANVSGRAIAFLQVALGMTKVDRNGFYGPLTVAKTKALQESADLEPTGVFGEAEWALLAR